jgi:hypothetical protein
LRAGGKAGLSTNWTIDLLIATSVFAARRGDVDSDGLAPIFPACRASRGRGALRDMLCRGVKGRPQTPVPSRRPSG